jgi:hypothetical protein
MVALSFSEGGGCGGVGIAAAVSGRVQEVDVTTISRMRV